MPAELASVDAALAELCDAARTIRGNLVELETDGGRELLARVPLEGESAGVWAAADRAIGELWGGLERLDELLGRAGAARGARRPQPEELRALLEGQSIELPRREVPLAERALLGGAERCSPAELLRRMSDAFDEAKTAVARISGAWEALAPRLDAVRRAQAQAEGVAGDATGRADLAGTAARLERLAGRLTTDPLAVAPAEIDGLAAAVARIRAELDASAGLATRIAGARELLGRLEAAERAAAAARDELAAKITDPAPPPAPLDPRLGAELARIAATADGGDRRTARARLERWTPRAAAALAEAERTFRAHRAPIESRNQLRGLLDAYEVKASRLGLVEDPRLTDILERARHELHTAPTDLALVGRLVRAYQEALTGAPGRPR